MCDTINIIEKKVRAEVIQEYLHAINKNTCVCFSCGNASAELKKTKLEVIEVISPSRWWSFVEIQQTYNCFDATSGHLPIPLMLEIGKRLLIEMPFLKERKIPIYLPTGSGETFICLKLVNPNLLIIPLYDLNAATKYEENAPLNNLIKSYKKQNYENR